MKNINYNPEYNSNETLNYMIKIIKERLAILNQENQELKQQISVLQIENTELKRKNENMRNELYKKGTPTIDNDTLLWQSFLNDFTEPYETEKKQNVLSQTRNTLRKHIELTQENLVEIYNLINELGDIL